MSVGGQRCLHGAGGSHPSWPPISGELPARVWLPWRPGVRMPQPQYAGARACLELRPFLGQSELTPQWGGNGLQTMMTWEARAGGDVGGAGLMEEPGPY